MLELRNVNTFYGNIQALRDVNIRINEGEIVTLIGANGAGKSTTLNILTGYLPAARLLAAAKSSSGGIPSTRSGRTKSWRSASARCRKAV